MGTYNITLDGSGAAAAPPISNVLNYVGGADTINVYISAGTAETNYIYGIVGDSGDLVYATLPEGWTAVQQGPVNPPGPETEGYVITVYDDEGNEAIQIFHNVTLAGVTNICFTAGSMIETAEGAKKIEDLVEGDMIVTRDHGLQPLRWVGRSKLTGETLDAMPHLRPVRIAAGALGDNVETVVSPAHRMLVDGWRAEALFGETEVLAAAGSMLNDSTITVAHDMAEVEYIHLMFDAHELVKVDGAWSESFHPAALNMGTAGEKAHAEVVAIFPELEADAAGFGSIKRPTLDAGSVRVIG